MNLTDLQRGFSGNEWPRFTAVNTAENTCTLTLAVDAEIHWFTGHFPAQPVLAGVVQTHWAAELGKRLFALSDDFQRIDNLKFQSVILPGQIIELHLQYLPQAQAIRFSYHSADGICSEGKLVF